MTTPQRQREKLTRAQRAMLMEFVRFCRLFPSPAALGYSPDIGSHCVLQRLGRKRFVVDGRITQAGRDALAESRP